MKKLLLEESRQLGLLVKYWLVKLQGKDGWPKGTPKRGYWLQVQQLVGRLALFREEVEL